MSDSNEKASILETWLIAYAIAVFYQMSGETPLGEALFMGIWISIPIGIIVAGVRGLISDFFKK